MANSSCLLEAGCLLKCSHQRCVFFRLVLLPHYLVSWEQSGGRRTYHQGNRSLLALCPLNGGARVSGAAPGRRMENSHPWQKRCEGAAAWQGAASSVTAGAGNAFKQEGLWLVLWLFSFVGFTAVPSAKELFGNLKAIGCRQRQLIF